ncbi:granzyme K [Danio rerio]|uniref:Granzyme A n=1 Tax=Danio rerio TaxID=7955 RepID=E9QD93_DANRE|nr:granzyme K-like [Danio rerio]XP_021324736.1 granzyme K-like [Danio rerio]|eukprot:XP_001335166.1 granzyme K-like [Danio rerio]
MDICRNLIVFHFLVFTFFKVTVCSDVSIVGGKDVKKALSWMVSIQVNQNHKCGGILIHKEWVLTAAHCKEDSYSSVTVLIGSLSLSKGSQRIAIHNYEIPETFNKKTKKDDIMLIRLSKKVKAKPYKIPKKEKDVQPGTKCVVRGWGTTDYKGKQASDKLQMLEVLVVDRVQCNRYYNRNPVITKDMLCAGNTQQHRGTCLGDSGGPLECEKNLVGVLSGSHGCGDPKKPTVYTLLSKRHITWINKILKQQFNSTRF